MVKNRLFSLFCAVICLLVMTTSAFAQTNRASDQISNYWMVATSSNREINVDFSVTGTGTMDQIGCESIYIYESSGSLWLEVEHFDENDAGMNRTNARKFANMVSVDCEVGVKYKVVVTIFAENSDGRDSRTQTFYVTGEV